MKIYCDIFMKQNNRGRGIDEVLFATVGTNGDEKSTTGYPMSSTTRCVALQGSLWDSVESRPRLQTSQNTAPRVSPGHSFHHPRSSFVHFLPTLCLDSSSSPDFSYCPFLQLHPLPALCWLVVVNAPPWPWLDLKRCSGTPPSGGLLGSRIKLA